MPFIFTYLIKLSFAIAIFYCMYRFALRQLTFYRWNRYFLSGYGLLSLVLPFVNIDFLLPGGDKNVITAIPSLNNVSLSQLAVTHDSYWLTEYYPSVLLWIFTSGAAYVVIRVVFQYKSLLKIRKAAVLVDSEEVELYDVDADISPFSFNNSIYFNSSLHPTDELAKILQHEFVHVKQRHIVDVTIAEFLCIINWFNPFVWLLRKAIRQNLEFIADQQVLESGIDAKQYQYLLLKVTGITPLGLTNHFNISSLKKRIVMMNKMRTAKVHLLKFLFILPLLSLVLVSFRNAAAANDEKKITAITGLQLRSDTIPQVAPPPPPAHPMGVQKEPRTLRLEQKDLPADVSSVTVSSKVTVKRKDGKTESYDMNSDEDMKAYESKYGRLVPPPPPAPPMPPAGKRQAIDLTSSGVFISADSVSVNNGVISPQGSNVKVRRINIDGHEPLIILDGKEIPEGTDLNAVIEPDNIESITVLKDASSKALYGDKAKNGVLIIVSKAGAASIEKPVNGTDLKPLMLQIKSGIGEKSNGSPVKVVISKKDQATSLPKDFNGLILLDGKEILKAELDKLEPNTIRSVDVLKGTAATSKYGRKGENGVIEVITN